MSSFAFRLSAAVNYLNINNVVNVGGHEDSYTCKWTALNRDTPPATLVKMVMISHLCVSACKHAQCVKLNLKPTLNGFLWYPRIVAVEEGEICTRNNVVGVLENRRFAVGKRKMFEGNTQAHTLISGYMTGQWIKCFNCHHAPTVFQRPHTRTPEGRKYGYASTNIWWRWTRYTNIVVICNFGSVFYFLVFVCLFSNLFCFFFSIFWVN